MKDTEKKTKGFDYVYTKGGVSITSSVDNPGESLFMLNPNDNSVLNKIDLVVSKLNLKYLHDAILPRSLFGIESDFVEKNPSLVREYHDGDEFNRESEIKLFTNDKAGKAGRARWYIADVSVLKSGHNELHRWKVVVSSANAGGQKRSNQIAVLDNYSAFGRARVALKTFDTEAEARNFYKYATSELIRFAFLQTDESLTSLAKRVPDLLDYSDSNKFIDYSKDVDAQLYQLFEIDSDSQNNIRSVLATKSE